MDTQMTGIVTRCVGGLYGVRPFPLSKNQESPILLCRARGIFRHENISPLPGDTVQLSPGDSRSSASSTESEKAQYVIDAILPRKNVLIRPPLANLTHLFLVIPTARPTPDLLTVNKLISLSEACEIEPVLIITKSDLDPMRAQELFSLYQQAGFSAFMTSANDPVSVDALRNFLFSLIHDEPVIAAFSGASGAGKSTMMTRLFPTLTLKTGDLSQKIGRGRQTTRHVELFPFAAENQIGFLADTPGFSMLDVTRSNDFDPAILPETFREFQPYLGKCRYTKCTHTKEEGCAILQAVRDGSIAEERLNSYIALFEEFKKKPDWKRRKEVKKSKS